MNKNIPATSLNIALIPTHEIFDQAIEMSKKVNEEVNAEFVLNYTLFLPHITVYQAHFPDKNIDKVKKTVAKIAEATKSIKIELQTFSINYKTFLFWTVEKSDALSNLQNQIIHVVNPLRDGLILPALSNIDLENKDDAYDIQHFGSLLIGEHYKPHITITRLKDEKHDKKALSVLKKFKEQQTFTAESVTLGYLGQHGTVNGIIPEYEFSDL